MARVLIIDDDPGVLRTLTEVVDTLGHEVVPAGGGREGIEQFDRGDFDCVLTDLAMPEVNGLAVLQHVKRTRPRTAVLVITGNSTVDLLAASVNMDADAYVTKPFKIRDLQDHLQRVEGRRAARDPGYLGPETGRGLAHRVSLGWAMLLAALLAILGHVSARWL